MDEDSTTSKESKVTVDRISLDNTTSVIESRSYTAYGNEPTSSVRSARTGYIGRETDAEHNLGAFGARLYSSEYGRFLAVDKLWEKYRSLQPYQYAGNSPVMNCDPSGLEVVFDNKVFETEHNKIYEEKDAQGNYANIDYREQYDKLHASDVKYIIRSSIIEKSEQIRGERSGSISTDGESVFVNIDMSKGGTYDREGTHELVHAEQFEDGLTWFFRDSPNDSWKIAGNSLALEQEAYEKQHTKHPAYERGGDRWLKTVYPLLPETSERNTDETLSARTVVRGPTGFGVFYPKGSK